MNSGESRDVGIYIMAMNVCMYICILYVSMCVSSTMYAKMYTGKWIVYLRERKTGSRGKYI